MKFLKKARQEEEDTLNAINITPLTDCMMVLLIIFMITGAAVSQTGFNIDLPSAGHRESPPVSAIVISVTKTGIYYVNGAETPRQNLSDYLAGIKSNESSVNIEADSRASYAEVMAAIDAAKRAGISQVGLSADIE